jgi:hypothetical protein
MKQVCSTLTAFGSGDPYRCACFGQRCNEGFRSRAKGSASFSISLLLGAFSFAHFTQKIPLFIGMRPVYRQTGCRPSHDGRKIRKPHGLALRSFGNLSLNPRARLLYTHLNHRPGFGAILARHLDSTKRA